MRGVNFVPLLARFKMQYSVVDGGCWEWAGTISSRGYGQIKDHYRTRLAHRVSYELHIGKIPNGKFVCHRCDNPRCVNPDHLFVGTCRDNMKDMMDKNRDWNRRGEGHNKAKLTWKSVNEIRGSAEDARVIAKRLGLCASTVYRARNGTTWNANRRQGA